jgi:hypothetical protein
MTETTNGESTISCMRNQLRRGATYRATTYAGQSVSGEYLGTEVSHGDWAILLRHRSGTTSIPIARLLAVVAAC